MDLGEPMVSVVPGVTGSVLAVLARAGEPLTGRAIAQMVKPSASQKGVANALGRLVTAGLVTRVDKGRAALFSLNRDHVAAAPVIALAHLRGHILERLADQIRRWASKPMSVTVFGSFARGDGGPDSDIDVLVVRPASRGEEWLQQLAGLASDGRRWTGNAINIVEIGEEDLPAFAAEPFVRAAATEGVTVFGLPLRRALRGAPG